jgi:hypothetical protein
VELIATGEGDGTVVELIATGGTDEGDVEFIFKKGNWIVYTILYVYIKILYLFTFAYLYLWKYGDLIFAGYFEVFFEIDESIFSEIV